MTLARYSQASGLFEIVEGVRIIHTATGYAGRGRGRNNPHAQDQRNVGPLPRGQYSIALPGHHPRLGPLAFRLFPDAATEMFGRSGFFIHGDSRDGDASQGCVILDRRTRQKVADLGVRRLLVE